MNYTVWLLLTTNKPYFYAYRGLSQALWQKRDGLPKQAL